MSPARSRLIRSDEFLIGYQLQREWAWLIAAAFFFGTVGAGLYFVSFVIDFHLGAVVALLIVGVCKGAAHMLFLGKPLRFPMAVRKWRTSWISRGVIAMFVFLGSGVVYVAGFPESSFVSNGVSQAFGWVALAAALVIMVYDGFVLRSCRGIPLWNTYLMPIVGLSYAFLGGTTVTLVLEVLSDEPTRKWLEWLQLGLLFLNVALLATLLVTARSRDTASQLSASLLTRGTTAPFFVVIAIGVGIVCTLALVAVSLATDSQAALIAAGATDLIGEFFLLLSLLRVGTHPALRSPSVAPFRAASLT
jgi:formate-dependent nitrite reductase membrane component NrfD